MQLINWILVGAFKANFHIVAEFEIVFNASPSRISGGRYGRYERYGKI